MSKMVPQCVNLTRSDWLSHVQGVRDEVQIIKRIRFMSDMQKNCRSGMSSNRWIGKKLCNASAINLGQEYKAELK